MNKYYHFLGFSLGLSVALFMSGMNALFMTPNTEWFINLKKPEIVPYVHSALWLVSYLLTAVIIGEFAVNKDLRRFAFVPIIFVALNIIWCWTFFRLHNLPVSCAVFALNIAALIAQLALSIKKTRYLWSVVALNVIWYGYLFAVFIFIMSTN